MEALISHSFLSNVVTQYKNFSFKQTTSEVGGRKRKELKKKKKKKKKANTKSLTETERTRERESPV